MCRVFVLPMGLPFGFPPLMLVYLASLGTDCFSDPLHKLSTLEMLANTRPWKLSGNTDKEHMMVFGFLCQNLFRVANNKLRCRDNEIDKSIDLWSSCIQARINGWQLAKWKRVFLTCPCHEIYSDEAVGLKSCKILEKYDICEMWKLGNIVKMRYFVNNYLIKLEFKNSFAHVWNI